MRAPGRGTTGALYLTRDKGAGESLCAEDLEPLRPAPAGTLAPWQKDEALGRPLAVAKKAGEALFEVVQGNRRARFHAPLSGTVVQVNERLAGDADAVEDLAYGDNWICVIESADLDAELGTLKIGKSAVSFFHEEFDHLLAFLNKVGVRDFDSLNVGAFEQLDDADWNNAVSEFFAH